MSATANKGKVGGGISVAATTATLPTDATTALAADFKSLGVISEDGVSRDTSIDTAVIKDWHGSVVAVLENGKTETFKFKCIDATNLEALGLVFGTATGTLADGITVKSTTDVKGKKAYVFESILSDNSVQRTVVPQGVITSLGSITYKGNDITGFEVTITAIADDTGVTAYDYIKAAS